MTRESGETLMDNVGQYRSQSLDCSTGGASVKFYRLPPQQGTYHKVNAPGVTARSEIRSMGRVVGHGPFIRYELMQIWAGNAWELPPCPHEGCPHTMEIMRGAWLDSLDVGGSPPTMCPQHGNADMVTLVIEELDMWTVAMSALGVEVKP